MSPRLNTILALAAVVLLPTFAGAADDPTAPISTIYKRIAANYSNGQRVQAKHRDTDNGYFVWRKQSRHRWFSRSLAALWDKSDALTPKGDAGPPGADPITASQDAQVIDPKVTLERHDGNAALVAATFRAFSEERVTVRYEMVRQNGAWKIDDIRTASDSKTDGFQWSTRKELAYYVEAMRTGRWIKPPNDSPNAQRVDR